MQTVKNRTKGKRIDSLINKDTVKSQIETIKPDKLTSLYLEVIQDKNVNLETLNTTIEKILTNKIDIEKIDSRYIRTAMKRTGFDNYRRQNFESRVFENFEIDKHSQIIDTNDIDYELSNIWLNLTVLKKLKQHKSKALFVFYYILGKKPKEIAKRFKITQQAVSLNLKTLNNRIANMEIERLIDSRFVLSDNGKNKIHCPQDYTEILKRDGLKKMRSGKKNKGVTVFASQVKSIDLENYNGIKSKQLTKDKYGKWVDDTALMSDSLKTSLRQTSGFISIDNMPYIGHASLKVVERPLEITANISNQDCIKNNYRKTASDIDCQFNSMSGNYIMSEKTRSLNIDTIKYYKTVNNEVCFTGLMFPNYVNARYELNQKTINQIWED